MTDIHCTRADALAMGTLDLSGFRGSSPTRGRTRLSRDELLWHNCSMATQMGGLWRFERRPLHSRGHPEDGHQRPLWLSRVVAKSGTHPAAAGSVCVTELFDDQTNRETLAL